MGKRTISLLWTFGALVAFAANSILCRAALGRHLIDPGTFTVVRLVSGAIVLALLVRLRHRQGPRAGGSWTSAAMLAGYAAPFSFAYMLLPAGTGAVILFGAVQATMITGDVLGGRRPRTSEWIGLLLALAGLGVLTRPGLDAPEPVAALLMGIAGMCWGAYSLRGRRSADPLATTGGNFLRGSVLVLPLLLYSVSSTHIQPVGFLLAVVSGAVASALGYAVWYHALRSISATQGAVAQLLVPLLAAVGGVAFLGEVFTVRLFISGTIIAIGVALAVVNFRFKAQQSEVVS